MNGSDIITRLKAHEAALKARGVAHAALFGSVARGEQRGDSDIDIMIELDPARPCDDVRLRGHKGVHRGPVPRPG